MLSRAREPERRVLRFYGASESEVARALAEAGGEGDGVTATICARDFEIHVDLFVEEEGERARGRARGRAARAARAGTCSPRTSARSRRSCSTLCRERGLTLATAESCTGGLVAARLTSVPGSSDVFLGGVVAYADEVKARELGVPAELLDGTAPSRPRRRRRWPPACGSGSEPTSAVAVTGIAGPGGGTPEKPVGLVSPARRGARRRARAASSTCPGDREAIRAPRGGRGAAPRAHASGTKS